MDLTTKIFLINLFLITFTAWVDNKFGITAPSDKVRLFVIYPWLALSIASVPVYIIYLIWWLL